MKRITGLLVFSLILMGTQLVQAQKFGFVNSAALLTELPEVKEMRRLAAAIVQQDLATVRK